MMFSKIVTTNSQNQNRFKKQVRYLAGCVILIALFVLFGWHYDVRVIMNPSSRMLVMNPVSSFCFIFSGIAFFLLTIKSNNPLLIYFILLVSFFLIFVGLAKLFIFFGAFDLHVDEFLYSEKMRAVKVSARMTMNTAISFFLIGISIFLSSTQAFNNRRLANYISLVVFLGALFAIIGYIYKVKEFYWPLLYIPMPWQSAVAFILLSLSCWLVNWSVGFMAVITSTNSGGTIARILLPATIMLPIIMGYIRILTHYRFPISLELGVTFLIISILFLFLMLILYVSFVINKKDEFAKIAEAKLAEMNAALEQKVVERTEEISRNEKSFRALIEHNTSAISLMDKDFNVIYRSPSAIRITGFTDEEKLKLNHTDLIHPDDKSTFLKARKEVLKFPGKTIRISFRTKHKAGHYIWLDGTLANMLNDPDVNAIIVNMWDVTETVEVEQKIKESNTNLNAIFHNISEGITFIDRNYQIKSFNETATAISLLNSTTPLAIGSSMLEYVEETRKDFFKTTIEKVFEGEKIEYDRAYNLDGNLIKWFNVSFNPVKEDEKITGACISSRDITERKLAEEKLASSEKRFRVLIENSSDSIMLTDENLKVNYQSPSVERLTGISIALRQSKPGIQYTHPDDLAMIKRVVEETFQKPGIPVPYQSRMLHVAGNYIWIEGVATNLLQEDSVKAIVFNYRDVTERKNLEDKQTLLVSIINSSDDAILSRTLDGIIISWNKGAERLYNFSAQEAIGKNVSILIPSNLADEEPLIIEKIKKGQSIEHYETQRMKKGGELIHISLTVSPIKDSKGNIIGASKIARDISSQKKAAERLAANEKKFRALIENITDAIVVHNEHGTLVYQSPSVERILGYAENEKKGILSIDLIHPENKDDFVKLNESLKNQSAHPLSFQYRFLHKGGYYIWLEGIVTNLLADASVQAFVANFRDISDRKKNEEEILKLNTELEERVVLRTSQLQEVNKEMESFAYSVSHDLRAPLRIINGYSQILLEDYGSKLDDEGHRTLNVVMSNAVKMGNLIDDLLNFSRLGKTQLVRTNVSMDRIISDVIQELTLSGAKKPAKIHIDHLEPAYCDPSLIKHVWMNLISNAFKYSSAKEHAEVEIGMKHEADQVIYFIRDNGAGFDMTYHDKMFGVFQRLHKVDQFPGTGVGLAIVHRIITRHNGRVWADARINEGATFYFTLGDEEPI